METQNSANGSPGTQPGEGSTAETPLDGVPPLSAVQLRAAELIMSGKRLGAVARDVGVNRGTIYRWKTQNPGFIARLRNWRMELDQAAGDRLMAMVEDAQDAIAMALQNGNAQVAFKLLGLMGCLKPPGIEPAIKEPEPSEAIKERDRLRELLRIAKEEQSVQISIMLLKDALARIAAPRAQSSPASAMPDAEKMVRDGALRCADPAPARPASD